MNSQTERHFENWDLFALGSLDEQEMNAMADHLASGCSKCASELASAQAMLAGIAATIDEVPVPEGAEHRLRQRLISDQPASTPAITLKRRYEKRTFPQRIPWLVTAACLLAVVALSISLARTRRQLLQANPISYQNRIATLEQQVKDLEQTDAIHRNSLKTAQERLAEAQSRVHELEMNLNQVKLQVLRFEQERRVPSALNDRVIALLQSAPLSQLDLKPTAGVHASARLLWKDDQGLLLVARDLPPVPNGSLQLWFARKNGAPVNVGVLEVDRSGAGILFVPPGTALNSMAGAMVTAQVGQEPVSEPGKEILKALP